MRIDYEKANRELTGNMPTGEYRMADVEFSVTHITPKQGESVQSHAEWLKRQQNEPDYTWFLI